MIEIWKDIPNYIGYYQASNLGRIRSINREILDCKGKKRKLKGKILKNILRKDGYLEVHLCKDKHDKKFIARLVLSAFNRIPLEKEEASHLDGNPLNNNIKNLKWETRIENESHKVEHGTLLKGEKIGNSKLKNKDIPIIRELSKNITRTALAKKYNVSVGLISLIVNRKLWNHI